MSGKPQSIRDGLGELVGYLAELSDNAKAAKKRSIQWDSILSAIVGGAIALAGTLLSEVGVAKAQKTREKQKMNFLLIELASGTGRPSEAGSAARELASMALSDDSVTEAICERLRGKDVPTLIFASSAISHIGEKAVGCSDELYRLLNWKSDQTVGAEHHPEHVVPSALYALASIGPSAKTTVGDGDVCKKVCVLFNQMGTGSPADRAQRYLKCECPGGG
jgi:hypothetical protein